MTEWLATTNPPIIPRGEVHVWIASVAIEAGKVARYRSLLSLDEEARAARFRREIDSRSYVVAKGVLRKLLASYLSAAAGSLQFSYSKLGKPRIAGTYSANNLEFSVSHSKDLAAFAFVLDHQIGVDIESVSSETDYLGLAKRFFAADEFTALAALPKQEQEAGFFGAWTRKEAYLKARGEGLSYGLNRVEVTLVPQEKPLLLKIDGDSVAASEWAVEHFEPGVNYLGAVATNTKGAVFRYFKLMQD